MPLGQRLTVPSSERNCSSVPAARATHHSRGSGHSTPSRNLYAGPSAVTALELLECDPESLLCPHLWGRRDKSAAKRAREHYEEALNGQPLEGGVLCGDIVLARNGNDEFQNVRVIRTYKENGCTFADVEWPRPGSQLNSLSDTGINCNADRNEILLRRGLRVGTDIFQLRPGGGVITVGEPRQSAQGATPSSALPDLIDLQNSCEIISSNDLLGDLSGSLPPTMASPVCSGSSLFRSIRTPTQEVLVSIPKSSSLAVGSTSSHTTLAASCVDSSTPRPMKVGLASSPTLVSKPAPQEFGFVAGMISDATGSAASTGR